MINYLLQVMKLEKISISSKNVKATNLILSKLNCEILRVLKIESFSGQLTENLVKFHNLQSLKVNSLVPDGFFDVLLSGQLS